MAKRWRKIGPGQLFLRALKVKPSSLKCRSNVPISAPPQKPTKCQQRSREQRCAQWRYSRRVARRAGQGRREAPQGKARRPPSRAPEASLARKRRVWSANLL